MGEVNDLPNTGHSAEQSENFLRPEMIEGFHDVIGDEGNRGPELGKLVISGEAQSQVELESGAFRQSVCDLGLAIPRALCRLGRQACVLAARYQCEGRLTPRSSFQSGDVRDRPGARSPQTSPQASIRYSGLPFPRFRGGRCGAPRQFGPQCCLRQSHRACRSPGYVGRAAVAVSHRGRRGAARLPPFQLRAHRDRGLPATTAPG